MFTLGIWRKNETPWRLNFSYLGLYRQYFPEAIPPSLLSARLLFDPTRCSEATEPSVSRGGKNMTWIQAEGFCVRVKQSCMSPPLIKHFMQHSCSVYFCACRPVYAIPYRWLRKPFFHRAWPQRSHTCLYTHIRQEERQIVGRELKKKRKKRPLLSRAACAQQGFWTRWMTFGS